MTTTSDAQTPAQANVRYTLHIQDNNDNGSLKVGLSAGTKVWGKGDKIELSTEPGKVRTVTFVMGQGEKTHLCFAKQGPLPKGQVDYRIVSAETALPSPSQLTEAEQAELAEMEKAEAVAA
jgi:hypothetical protein